MSIMRVRTDALCPLSQEEDETVLHQLGQCPAIISKRLDILGSCFRDYEDLDILHWSSFLRLAKVSKRAVCEGADGGARKGVGVTVPTGVDLSPESFSNATLSKKNHHMTTISVERVSSDSLLQLYLYVGSMTADDFRHFDDLSQVGLVA